MNNNNNLSEDEKFSDGVNEYFRMENNFLKMKLMLESGAEIDQMVRLKRLTNIWGALN